MIRHSAPPHVRAGRDAIKGHGFEPKLAANRGDLKCASRSASSGRRRELKAEQAMSKSREESVSYQDHREASVDLDRQYHKIGIPAVVAALRYQGDGPATDAAEGSAGSRDKAA